MHAMDAAPERPTRLAGTELELTAASVLVSYSTLARTQGPTPQKSRKRAWI